MNLQHVKCPKCGKKGLHYPNHPHAFGYKDYSKIVCRFCGARFKNSSLPEPIYDEDLLRACGDCGAELQIVRPGKYQCPKCGK
jgi:predicted RNA-binding Zn-ribbon protein involved in translation (DUF1610 family)